jgi:hypothetical protein
VGTYHPINYKLKYFEVDDQESSVNEEVENSRNEALEHFFLAKGDPDHVAQALAGLISDLILFAQEDVLPDAQNPLSNEVTGCSQDNYEKDLLE